MNQWDELRVNGVSLTHSPLAEYRDVFFFADKDVRQITSTQKSVVEQELNDLGVNGDLTAYIRYRKAFNDREDTNLRHFQAQATYFTDAYGNPIRIDEAEKRLKD